MGALPVVGPRVPWRRVFRTNVALALPDVSQAADLASLVRIVKRKLKKIQYRPHLIDGCLAGTGLTIEAW
jgi:hypothetical protein